jgi:hypothetical protein
MKLENQDWEKSSPGSLPDGAIYRFMDWARSIAAQARVRQDVFEDFKSAVKQLYKQLKSDAYNPCLDAVNLFAGQSWELETQKAVRASDIVLVCLSPHSVTRAGFMQKEIKFALDVAEEQPEGRIYIMPARLEECDVPARLSKFHWVDLFEDDGYESLNH